MTELADLQDDRIGGFIYLDNNQEKVQKAGGGSGFQITASIEDGEDSDDLSDDDYDGMEETSLEVNKFRHFRH